MPDVWHALAVQATGQDVTVARDQNLAALRTLNTALRRRDVDPLFELAEAELYEDDELDLVVELSRRELLHVVGTLREA
jgi:hypothetical protein